MIYSDFGFPFLLHRILFTAVPVLMLVIIGLAVVRSLKEWHHNEKSPRLTVEAEIVDKRTDVSRRRSANNHHSRTYTSYYVTFQFESGDRLELELQGHEYGLIVEGDRGKLTFQGTRYLGFERM